MRLAPSRYVTQAKPIVVKRVRAETAHISAPLKGLNMSTALSVGDPLTATVLRNFVVEDDRIVARAGRKKLFTDPDLKPIESLVPFYGLPEQLLAATNGKLVTSPAGTVLKSGFTGNDWSWTSFANLSQVKYTVMVNGSDGVWSWNGGQVLDPGGPVTATNLSKGNPAVITVGAADIGKFTNGMTVIVAGAVGAGLINANGSHVIGSVGSPVNTFQLVGVDTSTAAGPQTTGVTVDPQGSLVHEQVTAPVGKGYIVPAEFEMVLAHMARLWFADGSTLAVYYLPIQQMSGEVKELPLSAIFKRGGVIRALYTWTVDGGAGMDDQLVIFTSNGECAIYSGTDPDADFKLVGVFRFDAPMSKHCVVQYGGDLYVLTSVGLMPMSTLMRAESDQLAKVDRNVLSLFLQHSTAYRTSPGWALILNPSSGRLICNLPNGSLNSYRQLVRHMPKPVWSEWGEIPSRSWGWVDPNIYIGDDTGSVYEMHPRHLNDDGRPITVDVQMAWSLYKTTSIKQFKMVRPYIASTGVPRPYVDIKVDYDFTGPTNQPDVQVGDLGAVWDVATWDVDYWASGTRTWSNWSGVGRLGTVGAPRVTASLTNTEFAVIGWDVLYEEGAVFG